MQKLLITILLLCLSTIMVAKEIDLDKSKGIDQERIVSLHPKPAHMEVSQDITFKVVFDVELDAKHVKKNDIKLKRLSDKKKNIKGEIAYLSDEKAVTFKPEQDLEVGYYEIEIKSLKPVKEEKDKKIKEIKYRFYVPEVVNGYMLPIEPDESINNSTLLGVDSNDNGVRDDVERYVINHFAKDAEFPKTKTAIAMQYAWADQKIIENPTKDSMKYEDDVCDCKYYWYDKKTIDMGGYDSIQWTLKHKIYDNALKEKIFNTKERVKQYFKYNAALSGGIYQGRLHSLDNCRTNIDVIGE